MPQILPGLTSCRFFAAIWVVLFHLQGRVDFGDGVIAAIIKNGARGVDFFFILSGFVIFHAYGNVSQSRSFDLKTYMIKRLNRIYPLHFIVLVAFVFLGIGSSFFGSDRSIAFGPADILLSGLLLHAWQTTDGLVLNGPSWTISAELFAYLLFGLISLSSGLKYTLIRVFITTGLLAIIVHAIALWAGHTAFVHLTWDLGALRILPSFALGILLRMLAEKIGPGLAIGLGGLGLVSLVWIAQIPDVDYGILLPFCLIILSGACLSGKSWAPLNFKAFVYLGEISYSTYLVHSLILIIYFEYIPKLFPTIAAGLPPAFDLVGALFLVLVASAIGYHWIERPTRSYLNNRLIENTGQL